MSGKAACTLPCVKALTEPFALIVSESKSRKGGLMIKSCEVFVSPRGGGKTYQSLKWLTEGHALDTYPGWSRVLIVPNAVTREWTIREFERLMYKTDWNLELTPRVIISWTTARDNLKGMSKVELAIDGTREILEGILLQRFSLMTVDGELYEPSDMGQPTSSQIQHEYSSRMIRSTEEFNKLLGSDAE